MATFTGILPKKIFVTPDLRSTVNIKALVVDQTQKRAWVKKDPGAGAYALVKPLEILHSSYNGCLVEYLASFFYNRIHITPRELQLGNIVGVQQREITLWNAWLVPRTLVQLEKDNIEAITITNQPDPPIRFLPLEEKVWKIQVSPEGPPVVDANLTYDFDTGEKLPVHITGTRIVIWSFYPTWEGGMTETLEWMTSVVASPLGDDQRRSMRIAPRRGFKLQLIAEKNERRYMDQLIFAWGARNWAVPVWNDIQEIKTSIRAGDTFIPCQTFGRDFTVGGLVLLRGKDVFSYELAEITSITSTGVTTSRALLADWPIYTPVYPVRTARFTEQPTVSRLTDDAVSVSCNFQLTETSDCEAFVGSESYRGYPVFRVPPEESEDLTSTYIRLIQALDNNTGLPRYVDTANLGFTAQAYRWLADGRADQYNMRRLFYYLAGQYRSVWLPTHYRDLILVNQVKAEETALDVEYLGYTQFGHLLPGRRDIMITLVDGRVFFRRITGSEDYSQGVERLAIDTPLNIDLVPGMVERISFMARCRLEADSVEIAHQTDSDGVSATRVVFRSVRDDIT